MRAVLGVAAFLATGALGLTFAFSQAPSATPVPAATAPATGGSLSAYVSRAAATEAASGLPQGASGSARPVQVAQAGMGMLPPVAAPPPAVSPAPVLSAAPAAVPTTAAGVASAPSGVPAAPARAFQPWTAANVDGPYIAITFDDGPNPETTPKLLKMLQERGIKATFFVVGMRAIENPEILRKIVAEGHEIGNHSWNHPQLNKIPVEAADKQIADTTAAIENATGKPVRYLRPPYGAMTNPLRHHIEDKYGLSFIYWSVDSLDWKKREAQSIYDKIMAQTRPGGIILAHDIHPTTVAAMPRVLDALLAKGYKFVTISELIAMHKPEPAKVASLAPAAAPKPKKPKPAAAKPSGSTPATTASTGAPRPPASAKPASTSTGGTSQQKRSASSSGLY